MRAGELILPLLYGATRAAAVDSFDYIIVGAGTAGLVVANRLTEDPSVTVGVIEPGTDQRDNPDVSDWRRASVPLGTAVDWNYTTTKQSGANDRELEANQGKAWGGTSAINGMFYIRGDAAQFDAWEDLGNPGWNWDSLFPYFKKSEKHTVPSDAQLAGGATYEPQHHGFEGYVHTGYPLALRNSSFASTMLQTFKGLDVPHNPDFNGGDVYGFTAVPQTLDTKLDIRWDAARAYLYPIEQRSNLKIIQGTVTRILWESEKADRSSCGSDCSFARGVQFVTDDGEGHTLDAKKEVIISAGVYRTPLVLEGSGIGNPRILEALGIKTEVDLPGVGENLQDRSNNYLAFAGYMGASASAYMHFYKASDLFGSKITGIEASTRASLSKWAQAIVDASGSSALQVTAIEKLLRVQHDLLFKHNVTAAEILTGVAPLGVELFGSSFWTLMPFSRGNVHLQSTENIHKPLIDPRFFLIDFDLTTAVALGKLARKFWLSKRVNEFTKTQVVPPVNILPKDATDAQWESFMRANSTDNYHAIGTASMMPRELGGVVDPELRVYGTANVRVVDASVLPIRFSGHPMATIYAVAERAADIIKKAW
ncbi:hypothetical protein AJ80_05470 [Polytolypa hystricis UAMH7299]|uniref:glucose oxidase n=1 Tax=Polytolypa hystricis (strain UAMH7299) TaxID=1447883 RepID=A0A2B7Y2A1_POLH7|nr:hypothetical protein AJ80_05470 [Polytolypa hystricis UAMH7299]